MTKSIKVKLNDVGKIVGIVTSLVAVYFLVKWAIKKGKDQHVRNIPLPNTYTGQDGEVVTLTDSESAQVRNMAIALYDDMNGFNLWGHDMGLFIDYDLFNDTLFAATYLEFGKLYPDDGTLYAWINNETFVGSSTTIEHITNRLVSFGLT